MSTVLPRLVIVLGAGGGFDILADRPCRVFVTGGCFGRGHAELPPPRVGWPLVTAVLSAVEGSQALKFAETPRVCEGRAPKGGQQ